MGEFETQSSNTLEREGHDFFHLRMTFVRLLSGCSIKNTDWQLYLF